MARTTRCIGVWRGVMIDIDTELELAGWWWPPDQPAERVPGTLRCLAGQHPALSLIGGFDPQIWERTGPNSWEAGSEPRAWPLLLGVAEGKPVTLIQCQSSLFRRHFVGPPIEQTPTAIKALIGIHLEEPDQPVLRAIEVEVEDLLGWSAVSGIKEEIRFEAGRVPCPGSLSAEFAEQRTARVVDAQVTLHHGFRTGSDHTRSATTARITEHAWLTVEPDGLRPAESLTAYAKPLQDLLTLSTHRPAAVLAQVLLAPSIEEERSGGDPPSREREVRLYAKYIVEADPQADAVRPPDLLFSLADVAFEKIVPAWFDVEQRLAPACNMLFGLHYVREGYLESRLITAVSAAEALHRRIPFDPPMSEADFEALRGAVSDAAPPARRQWVRERFWNEPSLKQRLLDLATLPDPVAVEALLPDTERWATLAKRARNDLAHRGGSSSRTVSIGETYAVVEVTRAMLTLVLLAQTGLDASVQQRIVRDSPTFQQVGQLARKHLTRAHRQGHRGS